MTFDICLCAVTACGSLLEYVLGALHYDALQPHDILQYDAESKLNSLCLAAVTQDGNVLIDVPVDMRTPDIYIAAVTQNVGMFEYIPAHILTQVHLCMQLVYPGIISNMYLVI